VHRVRYLCRSVCRVLNFTDKGCVLSQGVCGGMHESGVRTQCTLPGPPHSVADLDIPSCGIQVISSIDTVTRTTTVTTSKPRAHSLSPPKTLETDTITNDLRVVNRKMPVGLLTQYNYFTDVLLSLILILSLFIGT
jgi:hypothetical protein